MQTVASRLEGTSRTRQTRLHSSQSVNFLPNHKDFVQAIINAVDESIIVVDRRGTIRLLNNTAAQRLGGTPEALTGIRTVDLDPHVVATDLTEFRLRCIQEVLRSGKPLRAEESLGDIVFDTRYHPVFDSTGRASYVAIFGQDITGHEPAKHPTGCGLRLIHRDATSSSGSTVQEVVSTKPLTTTETQILRLITNGKSNKEVATQLCRSERTIEVHRQHIMRKLDAHNIADLVRHVIQQGLV